MAKTTVLYDLGALISDDLADSAEWIAETLDRSVADIEETIKRNQQRYSEGRISQGTYWETTADELGLEETDVLATAAINAAKVNQSLLGRVRAQSLTMRLGLISDATPDWVAHWRKTLDLDELFHASVIGSDFDEARAYRDLLTIGAERLQAEPREVWLVDHRAAHLETARQAGLKAIDLAGEVDHKQAFSVLG